MMGLPHHGRKTTAMPQTIKELLTLGRCSHEFSWPRRSADDGDYYQVCLLCAAAYKYDWTTMKRTERVEHKLETGIRRTHKREKRPTWTPRARRLKLDIPIRYRVNRTATWYEGIIENISQSGILFHGPQELPVNALVQLVFEMPEEISGQQNRQVVSQGRIMRYRGTQEDSDSDQIALAASIVDYTFVH